MFALSKKWGLEKITDSDGDGMWEFVRVGPLAARMDGDVWHALRFRAAIRPAVLRAVLVLGLASCVSTLGPGPHNPLRLPEEDDGLELYGWDADAREEQDEWGMPAFRERHIKVQRLSPSFGRHAGGLLVNITGKGVAHASTS